MHSGTGPATIPFILCTLFSLSPYFTHIIYTPSRCSPFLSLSVSLAPQARVQSEQEEKEKECMAREEAAEASHLQREAELQQKIATLTDTVRSFATVEPPNK